MGFHEAGFEIFESVLTDSECDLLIYRLCPDGSRAGRRHLMREPMVSGLSQDPRLLTITRQLFGRELVPYKATLFQKSGKANWLVAWHQDTALPVETVPETEGWGPASVKDGVTFALAPTSALSQILALRVHLDESNSGNGPLRVIPGSHRRRLVDDQDFCEWTAGDPVECAVGRGGVLAMSPLLLHASSKCVADAPRRVLHVEYAESLEIGGARLAVS